MQAASGVNVEEIDGPRDLVAHVLDVLERLGGPGVRRARAWMFWPTMMIGSSTSCRKLELIHKMSSCVLWMLSGRLISAMAANT